MYSDEEKARYIQIMWYEGLTARAAAEKFGNSPGQKTLLKWLKEVERGELVVERPKVPGACEHRPHKHYPEETKAEAIRRFLQGDRPVHIARSLGISDTDLIRAWVKKYLENSKMSNRSTKGTPLQKGSSDMTTDEQSAAQIKALKEKNAQLKRELEREQKELEREQKELEHERMMFRSVLEVFRDPKAEDLPKLSTRVLVGFAEKLRQDFGISLKTILSTTNISKSTYEYNRKKLAEPTKRLNDHAFDEAVRCAFKKSNATYGYRRLRAYMMQEGLSVPEKRLRASMHRQNLVAHCARRHPGYHSYKGELDGAHLSNLLINEYGRHNFSADAPNRKWLTDMSELRASDGRLYLSVIIDCFDGCCISWAISEHPNMELALSTLMPALDGLSCSEKPLLHSDRGNLYQAHSWDDACKDKTLRSMSRKAHPQDNAACESFFGFLKCELYYPLKLERLSCEELKEQLDSYIRWYDEDRLKAFKEKDGTTHYETIDGRRKRLGLTV